MNATDKLIETFASKLSSLGLPIREEDNKTRMELSEAKLPRRLPQSFAWFLSRYSFPACDLAGSALFGWESASTAYIEEALAPKGSLSELLIPAGYVQIGQPDTGSFDAVCFDLNEPRQNRECRIVNVDQERSSATGGFASPLNCRPVLSNWSRACFLARCLTSLTKTQMRRCCEAQLYSANEFRS